MWSSNSDFHAYAAEKSLTELSCLTIIMSIFLFFLLITFLKAIYLLFTYLFLLICMFANMCVLIQYARFVPPKPEESTGFYKTEVIDGYEFWQQWPGLLEKQ